MRKVKLLQRNRVIQPCQRRIPAIHQLRPALENILLGVDVPALDATRAKADSSGSVSCSRASSDALEYGLGTATGHQGVESYVGTYGVKGSAKDSDVVRGWLGLAVHEAIHIGKAGERGEAGELATTGDVDLVRLSEEELLRFNACDWGKDDVSRVGG